MSYRILIVDDTKFLRLMLTDILSKSGYEVVGQAENGLIGVEMFKELKPDIVIMDITMPEMDGITALKEIRAFDSRSVVLICSAMSQRDLISKALKAGANNYVTKPFEPERVNEIIQEVLPLVDKNKLDELHEVESNRIHELNRMNELNYQKELNHQIELKHINEVKRDNEIDQTKVIPKNQDEELIINFVMEEDLIEELLVKDEVVEEVAIEDESETSEQGEPEIVSQQIVQAEPREEFGSLLQNDDASRDDFKFNTAEEVAATILDQEIEKIDEELTVEVKGNSDKVLDITSERATEIEKSNHEDEVIETENITDEAELDADEIAAEEAIEENEAVNAEAQSHDDWLDDFITSNTKKSGDSTMSGYQQTMEKNKEGQADQNKEIVPVDSTHNQLEIKRKSMRNFASSFMCKWTEQIDDKEVNYIIVYSEYDKSIRFDKTSSDDTRESLQLSLDGFSFIIDWLEQKGVKFERFI
ncbi:hypothetical protein JCM16418A_40670 [Paenibacillus pini]|uniref:Chemotaxis regulator n=1 Tax=Paenibacillus pini JCM 16418 TaxID=1236976 RepID=W7Z4I4_9BACL|nr:chemotaxis regulator [Paenibacillus pini JCM 16418]